MGSFSPAGAWRTLRVLALCAVVAGTIAAVALAAGPGGWDHLGDRGTAGSDSLDLVASALTSTPGLLYVGGDFTDAGGIPAADRIATWNGSSWAAVSSSDSQFPPGGGVLDIAVSGGKVYAGGSFTNAGGNANADFLAVWDGASWKPFCTAPGPAFDGNVHSLQIIGQTLYVGGAFQNGAGFASADYLLACDLATGAPHPTVIDSAHAFSGTVLALAADSEGTLYAGGGFTILNTPAASDVVSLQAGGTWKAMGTGGGACQCAVTTFVRGLTAVGTDLYVGTDANDVGGIPQADHVARWDGSEWWAVGAGSGGADGWFPTTASVEDLSSDGSNLFVTGTFQNAGGDPRADNVAFFDGTAWHPLGSDGAGNGPWTGTRPRARDHRSAALCGGELHHRRRRQPSAVRRLVRALAGHRLPDAHGHGGSERGPDADGDPWPERGSDADGDPGTRRRGAPHVAAQGEDRPGPAQGDVLLRLQRAGLQVPLQLDRGKFKSCASPKTYKRLALRRAHVPRQGARPRRQRRCLARGQAVQDQEAIARAAGVRRRAARG